MIDPINSDKAYRLINKNLFSSVSAVFNLRTDGKSVEGSIDGNYYSFKKQEIVSGEYTLCEKEFDIFTKPDIKDGFGVFGLTKLYNMGGSVKNFKVFGDFAVFELADTGEAAFYCESNPTEVLCGGNNTEFSYKDGVVKIITDYTDVVIKNNLIVYCNFKFTYINRLTRRILFWKKEQLN